jgi:hypothetical protein
MSKNWDLIVFRGRCDEGGSKENRRTGMQCKAYHVDAIGGGPLTKEGHRFITDMKIKSLYKPLSRAQRIGRLVIGCIHLLTAIARFGTIFYVHILLKPAYAASGSRRANCFSAGSRS